MLDDKLYLNRLGSIYNFEYNDEDLLGLDTSTGHIGLPTISPLAKIYLLSNSISDELIRFAYSDTNYTSLCVNSNGELLITNKIICFAGSSTKAGGLQLQAGTLKTVTSVNDAGSIEFDGFHMYYVDILGERQLFGVGEVTTIHSGLTNLQGGIPGQYYHLSLDQHTIVVNLSAVTTNGVVRKNNSIFTASAVTWDEITNKPLEIPPILGNQNKYLTTDGLNLAWGVVDQISNNNSSPFKKENLIAGICTIDATNAAEITSMEYTIVARDNISGNIKTCKILVLHSNDEVFYTEYAQLLSNDNYSIATFDFIFNIVTKDIELNAITISSNTTIQGYKDILNSLERTFNFTFTTSSLDTVLIDYTIATTVEYILLAKDTDTNDTKTCKLIVVNMNNEVFYTEYAQLLSNDNLPIVIFDAVFNIDLQRIELNATPYSENIIIEGFKEIIH